MLPASCRKYTRVLCGSSCKRPRCIFAFWLQDRSWESPVHFTSTQNAKHIRSVFIDFRSGHPWVCEGVFYWKAGDAFSTYGGLSSQLVVRSTLHTVLHLYRTWKCDHTCGVASFVPWHIIGVVYFVLQICSSMSSFSYARRPPSVCIPFHNHKKNQASKASLSLWRNFRFAGGCSVFGIQRSLFAICLR